MFKKKFKVRVKHRFLKYYVVQFAHYRFIPVYHSLYYWVDCLLPFKGRWVLIILDREEAENLAKRFKSIEDVRAFYEKDEERERDSCNNRREYYDKKVPYKTKYF